MDKTRPDRYLRDCVSNTMCGYYKSDELQVTTTYNCCSSDLCNDSTANFSNNDSTMTAQASIASMLLVALPVFILNIFLH